MTNEVILETLKVKPLTEEEKQSRHILKRLVGPIASCQEGTRNGRRYNKELWEHALNDEIFKEKVFNKGLFLELGHPDREEIDMTCACACIPELPKIIDGDLYAIVDVLDTPAGNILNTLIDYGFRPGISSRGTGDIVGDEVDPNSFCLETWDIVNVPALEKARLSITEGLESKNLRKALCESIEKENEEHKKIMIEALENVGININNESIPEKGGDISKENMNLKQTTEETEEATNGGTEAIIQSLQESLKSNAELEARVKALQEELAVSNTKVNTLEEELSKSKNTIVHLSTLAKGSREKTEKISTLEEELKKANQTIENLKKTPVRESIEPSKHLRESFVKKVAELKSKTEEVAKLTEELSTLKTSTSSEINSLKENLRIEKKAHTDEVRGLTEKLNRKTQLIKERNKLIEHLSSKYIENKATQLAVKVEEIINRLPENPNLDDVDRVCEELMTYKINVSKLPFELDNKSVVTLRESKHKGITPVASDDDDIDESTYKWLGLK